MSSDEAKELYVWKGLNPYSTGRYSMSIHNTNDCIGFISCLNPYSTGRYSMRSPPKVVCISLYLCLNPYSTGRYSMRMDFDFDNNKMIGLNPYSTGRHSMSSSISIKL